MREGPAAAHTMQYNTTRSPVRKENAALEEGVRRAPRQPLYPRHKLRIYVLAAKLHIAG